MQVGFVCSRLVRFGSLSSWVCTIENRANKHMVRFKAHLQRNWTEWNEARPKNCEDKCLQTFSIDNWVSIYAFKAAMQSIEL